MLARSLVLLLSGAALLGVAPASALRVPPTLLDLEPGVGAVPIHAHTEPPAQRVAHTLAGRQGPATTVTRPLNDPSSISALLSQLSTATATSTGTSAANATETGKTSSSSSSIAFLSIGSEPTDFGSSVAPSATATTTAKAGGGGNGAAAGLSMGSVRAGVVIAGALAAYMALA